eukprot:gene10014-20845_t
MFKSMFGKKETKPPAEVVKVEPVPEKRSSASARAASTSSRAVVEPPVQAASPVQEKAPVKAAPAPAPVPVPVPVVEAPKSEAEPKGKPAIDWKEALNQVGGDRDFLNEVLQDLLEEATTADNDIGAAVENKDFGGVMRAAHRIKGSASYLSCDPLRDVSFTLQNLGHEGEEDPKKEELWPEKIIPNYQLFRKLVKELREAIAAGVPDVV